MQDQNNALIDTAPPPPYQLLTDNMYLSEMNSNAWPSSYYGRSKRIDLAKFYHDILKASTNTEDQDANGFIDSSSDEDEHQLNQNNTTTVTLAHNGMHGTAANVVSVLTIAENDVSKTTAKKDKKVRFSEETPIIHEYEPEYDDLMTKTTTTTKRINALGGISLFDEGWPGRTKVAMKSDGFMDFKSKIEAKLGAINDPSLLSQLDSCNAQQGSLLFNQQGTAFDGEQVEEASSRGYYRHRKSPLVQKLNLKPIPNTDLLPEEEEEEAPKLMEDTLSPSNSYSDSPITPKDNTLCTIPPLVKNASISSTTSSTTTPSILSPGGSKWLNRTLSKLRSNSPSSSRSK